VEDHRRVLDPSDVGWAESGLGAISAPLDDHRKLVGSDPPPGVGDTVGVAVGDVVGTLPVQAVPFTANDAGAEFEPLQEPLKPKLVPAPVPRLPL
jgi:hypothetical protein